jgi:PKD repeat protein
MKKWSIISILILSVLLMGASRERHVYVRSQKIVQSTPLIYVVALVADFTASGSVNGRAPQTIDFTDTSGGDPLSWSWDFGDGQTSTEQNPTHIFNTGTACNVTLTATNDASSDDEVKTAFVDLLDPYWVPTVYDISCDALKAGIANLTFGTSGGTVGIRYINDDTNAQVGIDKTDSSEPYTFQGVTMTGTYWRVEYWVTSAPAGFAAWGSSSNRIVLMPRNEWVPNQVATGLNVVDTTP